MATMKSSGDLIASISADMADNNAGLISAEDVRSNMEDTAFSINKIVASGDTETAFPFYNNVTIKKTGSNKGELYVESAASGVVAGRGFATFGLTAGPRHKRL